MEKQVVLMREKHIFFFLLALCICLGACRERIYSNEEYGFEIQIPKGFRIYGITPSISRPNFDFVVLFMTDFEHELDDFRENIGIEIVRSQPNGSTALFCKSYIDLLRDLDSGFVLIDSGTTQSETGLQMPWVTFWTTLTGEAALQVVYFVSLGPGEFCTIGGTTIDLPSYQRKWKEVFFETAESIEIAK